LDIPPEVSGQESRKKQTYEKIRYRRCAVKGRETRASQFWLDLPYVIWTYADNRVVYLNRHYQAIIEKLPDGTVRRVKPDTWTSGKGEPQRQYLYNDGNSPNFDLKTRRMLDAMLVELGVPRERKKKHATDAEIAECRVNFQSTLRDAAKVGAP
jgi:hypothetical protein